MTSRPNIRELEGYGCWWSEGYIAKEEYGHVASHYAFPVAMFILIQWDEYFDNPKMAIALSIPAFVSLVYHTYLTKERRHHFVCNCFMIADYTAIATGVTLGLLWNIPIVAPTLPFILSAMGALTYILLSDYCFHSRAMHAIWHIISLVPLLVYVAVDLKPSQSHKGQGEEIETAAWILFGLLTFATTVTTWWTWKYCNDNPTGTGKSTYRRVLDSDELNY